MNEINNIQQKNTGEEKNVVPISWGDWSEQIRSLTTQVTALKDENDTLCNSTCWQMTAPIRKLLDFMKLCCKNGQKTVIYLKNYGLKETFVKIRHEIQKNKKLDNLGKYTNTCFTREIKHSIHSPEHVIDIIIPIYNAYDYTQRCIETVLKNTDVNFNLYLIDDCSTDIRINELLADVFHFPKNDHLITLQVERNKMNLGFIKTVNKGIALGNNDVVLLNTDTEVPPNWLSRLISPALKDQMVASVTPFSNSATICSFPDFCKDNVIPYNLTVNEIDKVFAEHGSSDALEIPTGVGFCMFMRRLCLNEFGVLDPIYGKGYGEENDWCMRVRKHGYKNVLVQNLFVYHKHGVSFAEHKDKKREDRIRENMHFLLQRYPHYNSLIADFIRRDPGKSEREFLKSVLFAESHKSQEGVLFILHSMGGGTKVYQDTLIEKWKGQKRLYCIELQNSNQRTLLLRDYNSEVCLKLDFSNMDEHVFKRITQKLSIDLIYINQLVTYPQQKVISMIQNSRIPYDYFIHDYFCVCPRITLLDSSGKYCNHCNDDDKCNKCLKSFHLKPVEPIQIWRKRFHRFLSDARNIYAPSQIAADIVNSYYNDLVISVREHEIAHYLYNSYQEQFALQQELIVVVLGAISEEKGASLIYSLAQKIESGNLPIKIKVLGFTNKHRFYKSSSGVLEIIGQYAKENISGLLAQLQASLVLIPSIWPETYSYTASEAIYSGYPVVAFDIGAPADRIKSFNCGFVIDGIISSDRILDTLLKLLHNKKLLLEKMNNIKSITH